MTEESRNNPAGTTMCSCCGERYASDRLVRMGCRDDVVVCSACIGWLAEHGDRGRLRRAVPILPTTDLDRALAHYAALGFDTEAWEGGGYGFVVRDGVEVHLSQVDDGSGRAADAVTWYLHVHDADALHSEWAASAVAGELVAPVDTAWGKREGRHTDPDGNTVRFGSHGGPV